MRLHQAGKVTNDAKGLFDGVSVTTFALGSSELYRWLDGNEQVAFVPGAGGQRPHRHRPQPLLRLDQRRARASTSTARWWPTTSTASRSPGSAATRTSWPAPRLRIDDHSLICLRSTAVANGVTRSRIVPVLPEGSVVSTPRHHTGVVDHRVRRRRPVRASPCGSGPPPWPRSPTPTSGTSCRARPTTLGPALTGWTDPDDDRPAALTLATFNVHMGVDGWGRPFDVVGGVPAARRRRAGPAGVVDPRRRRPRARPPQWPTALGYAGRGRGRAGPWPPVLARLTQPIDRWGRRRRARSARRSASTTSAGPRPGPADRPFVAGHWGVALLARVPVRDVAVIPLGKLRRDPARRAVIGCTVDLGGRETSSSSAPTCPTSPTGRTPSTAAWRACCPRVDTAAVLAGDMNMWGPPVSSFFRGWRRAVVGRTWPARRPHSQLDHVLATPPVSVVERPGGRARRLRPPPGGGHPGRWP